jgi:hypothetical protein
MRTPRLFSSLLVLALAAAAAPGARAQVMVVGKLTYDRQAAAGDRYTGSLTLMNSGAKAETASIYQKDYSFSAGGESVFGDPGSLPRSNAAWVSFSPNRITIPPGQKAELSYTVTVPRGAAVSGTYWSVLFVEQVPDEPVKVPAASPDTFRLSIRQVIRYAVQIVTTVGSAGKSGLKFQNAKLAREGTARLLRVDVEDTGDVWLRPHLYVDLYDQMGEYRGRHDGGTQRLYPGSSVRGSFDLGDAPAGVYKALVIADAGGEDIFGATYTLTVEP